MVYVCRLFESNLEFFVVKQSFFTTFVDITTLPSASLGINFHYLFTLVMPSTLLIVRYKIKVATQSSSRG
jgi:hypothetical protein